jgi:SAM-dependent methyltransferase
MRSVKSSLQGWNNAAAYLAVLIVIFLHALGLGDGWPQEPAQPRFEEEIAKQEKIYRSRGADVPGGYVTNRALSDYAELLPTGFCDALGRLGTSDRWLDIGAGTGQAILDYYAPEDDAAPAERCARTYSKARAVAMSIEDRRTDQWKQLAAILGGDRIRYLYGKRLRYYSGEELGKFQIITDVYGGFSYTEDLSQFLEKVLSLLETGGVFYTMVQSVHLEDGKNKLNSWYLTELVDAAGRDMKVCSWLKKTTCVQVGCESKSEWDAPTELINIRKVCSDVSVPRMKLLKYEAGNPPGRRFQLEPQSGGVGFKARVRDERNKMVESLEVKD